MALICSDCGFDMCSMRPPGPEHCANCHGRYWAEDADSRGERVLYLIPDKGTYLPQPGVPADNPAADEPLVFEAS